MVSVAELEQDEDIENWLEKLEDAILAKNGEVPDARKLATLRNSIGSRSLPIIKQLQKICLRQIEMIMRKSRLL